MKNTIEANLRMWDRTHDWTKDGDEWDGQARSSGIPYEDWKRSIVDTFLLPALSPSCACLEIAPGHGRWTETLAEHCRSLTLVDLSPACLEHCRQRFSRFDHIVYRRTDGTTLPEVADGSVDFVWSFDAFVHMEPAVIGAYFHEIRRVLRPGGRAVIHHAGRRDAALLFAFLRNWTALGNRLYKRISMADPADDDGWRSDVSRESLCRLAGAAGLVVSGQTQFGVPRYGDWITTLALPPR